MKTKKAFTLIELLVVIAIIALLIAIILPSLGAVKKLAQGVVCRANLSGLTRCWYLYAQDNDDQLVGTSTSSTEDPYYSWVAYPMDETGNPVASLGDKFVEDEIRGIEKGLLYPYVEAVESYNCKGDRRSLTTPAAGGTGNGGYRSYSLAAGAGPCPQSEITWQGYEPCIKLNQIKTPGNKYIIVEEKDGRGMNMNSWVLRPQDTGKWVDPVADWHVGSSTFGFADGHSESHKWKQKEVLEMAKEQIFYLDAPGKDTDWMHNGFPYLKLN